MHIYIFTFVSKEEKVFFKLNQIFDRVLNKISIIKKTILTINKCLIAKICTFKLFKRLYFFLSFVFKIQFEVYGT
jgi:hypothetical protein